MICLIAGPLFGPFHGLRLTADLICGDLLSPKTFADAIFVSLSLNVAVLGLLVLPNFIGMARRRLAPFWRMLLGPPYLLAMRVACWRALWQWTRRPFAWTKTEHAPRELREKVEAADEAQAASGLRNFPASASAINARLLSTP
jgi:hypothetical protein